MGKLNDHEQICWAFDILPSQYHILIWTTCWFDVTYKIKLKTDEISTNHLQIYNSISDIATALLGGKKEKPKVVNEMAPDEAERELNNFFSQFGASQ